MSKGAWMAKIAAAHKEGATMDLDEFRDSAGVFRVSAPTRTAQSCGAPENETRAYLGRLERVCPTRCGARCSSASRTTA